MNLFPEKHLFEELKAKAYDLDIPKIKLSDYSYITENLKYSLFKWQEEALINFLTFEAIKEKEEDFEPTHLLFNMATGTGKTLVMAATILYYYKKKCRNFIFFVNQNNIVGKTEENLCNPSHNKYLFKQNVVIDDTIVNIKKVNVFAEESDDIQIKFTSIHSLHNDVYKVKEDSVFLEDLQRKDIVMLGDEAHHLNADTKKNKVSQFDIEGKELSSQDDIEKSWEYTVINLLLHKGQAKPKTKNKNVLLEFTATIPENKEVRAKYLSKTIAKFDLKDFLRAGYTKEINLVSSSFDKKRRILQALLFNWYRHKMALKYGIPNFKPVILFRSKTVDIAEQNNSKEDFGFFNDLIQNLSFSDFDFLNEIDERLLMNITETYQKGQSRIIDVKRYIVQNEISYKEIIDYLQDYFNERNCIITNSKSNKTKKEKTDDETNRLLNSLEDKENHVRAIFTVQRLTEGWDVQNLFDIVRLYEGQNAGGSNKGKSGGATTSEVQLIGRGVRYYPFAFEEKEANKRKFDNAVEHELRVLEEFYFHSDNDERYLSELKKELKDKEWLIDNKILKDFGLKAKFAEENKSLLLFGNTRLDNPNKKKRNLSEMKAEFVFEYEIEILEINESSIVLEKGESDKTRYDSGNNEGGSRVILLKDIDLHIIRKAINIHTRKDNSVFKFKNLKEELAINSMDEILKDEFFGNLKITLKFPTKIYDSNLLAVDNLRLAGNGQILKLLVKLFEKLSVELKQISNPYIGSEFTPQLMTSIFGKSKTKSIIPDSENTALEIELISKEWYALNAFYGTSEERNLIDFLKGIMANFESKYERIHLLRNEEVYKIFDFEKGRGFMPDFLLLLKTRNEETYYQIFIEPKGDQFRDAQGLFFDGKEGWKEKFLEEITNKYPSVKALSIEDKNFRLIGLPLYNQKNNSKFVEEVNEILEVGV
jgi:type III restriction enzyme